MLSVSRKMIYVLVCLSFLLSLTGVQPAYAAGIVVNTNADNIIDDGLCTLREAIIVANSDFEIAGFINGGCPAGSGSDTITFAGNYTITLGSILPSANSTIIINGNGAENTIIQANAAPNTATYRNFFVQPGGDLTLNQLTVRHGVCTGSCTSNTDQGGGILNWGTLTINNSLVSANTSSDGGGGILNEGGTVTITNSSFINNSSYNAGGAINNNSGLMTIVNSTITNNTSTDNVAGGVINSATLSVYNSTLSGNTSNSGVFDGANLTQYAGVSNLYNSIIANSGGTDGDCGYVAGTINASNTLIESTGALACNLTNGVNGNIIGSDPALGSITGSPAYFPLNTGSLAINAGSNAICAAAPVNNQSQNGVTRPSGSACDIGSYEAPPSGISVTIGGVNQGTYNLAANNSQSLKYPVTGGPVVISSANGTNIIASLNQWRRQTAATPFTGVAQSMALPVNLITDTYVIPRYVGNDPTLYNAILMANVDTVSRDITVTIGGVVRGTYTLAPSASQFVVYNGVVGGPVVVNSTSGSKIVASLYELKRGGSSGGWTGQSEMMGVPYGQLSNEYLIPIYFGDPVHVALDARLFIANADTVTRDITVTIGGVTKGTYTLAPNTSQSLKYPVTGGPVVVSSPPGSKIIASLNQWRRESAATPFTGVAQSMALPVSLITNRYVIPRYVGNDATLYNAVLMANVDTVPRDITVTIGGVVRGTYTLAPSASRFEVYTGVVGGPIVVSSVNGAKIVASLYELKRGTASGGWTGQSEMMGLPYEQLSDQYLIPIYFGDPVHVALDARLFIAVP